VLPSRLTKKITLLACFREKPSSTLKQETRVFVFIPSVNRDKFRDIALSRATTTSKSSPLQYLLPSSHSTPQRHELLTVSFNNQTNKPASQATNPRSSRSLPSQPLISRLLCSQGHLLSRFRSLPLGLHFGEFRRPSCDRPDSCPRHGEDTEWYVTCNTCLQKKPKFISNFIRFWQYNAKKYVINKFW